MKTRFRFRKIIVMALVAAAALQARADSFFWAINQFTTVQKINGDTGAVVQSFAVPVGSGSGASIAVVGNTGYYTLLGNANVYSMNMTTGATSGIAFTVATGNTGYMNSITNTADGHLWFGYGSSGAGNRLEEYTTGGTLLSSHAFPNSAIAYRDGLMVFGGQVVANRGDQTGPYDRYNIPGANNVALTVDALAFINEFDTGNNGIAFNGTNFYVANEQAHIVKKFDANGLFISSASLDRFSRYENWTFASQDIVVPPPPNGVPDSGSTLPLLGLALAGMLMLRQRKQA